MALTPGSRLGPYEVTAQIGAGGMGEVYQATDTNLKRQVAMKVLPESVAGDAERLARFQREAEVLAQLNHPNIAAIYGLERADGQTALVMELVEGPTLADRIGIGSQGPTAKSHGVPLDEALPIAKQIAEALEAAHEQGIVHRDLKPANIKVRPDGTVKVLDFGLAKAMDPMGAAVPAHVSQLPTITTPAMTQAGMILGTAAYMSPEQAKGNRVDARADIWAFGAVLYEMLSGRRAFDAEGVPETLAAVLRAEVDLNALPGGVPPAVRVVIRRSLQKDPRQRIAHMQDVRLAIDGAFEAGGRTLDVAAPPQAGWRRAVPWVAGAVLGGALIGAVAWATLRPAAPSVQRYNLALDATAPIQTSGNTNDVAISPDGQQMVYPSGADGVQLRLLSLSDGSSSVLVADGRPSMPFFSPDGAWVGFFDQPAQQLRRVPVDGGPVEVIARAGVQLRGATWGMDGTIVYASGVTNGLLRVPATGGSPEPLTVPETGSVHGWPSFLPDGRALLFAVAEAASGREAFRIAVLSLDTSTWDVLDVRGTSPQYTANGYLVYALEDALRAVPFDVAGRRVTGEPVTVETGVLAKTTGAADYAVSAAGSLVFAPAAAAQTQALGWVTRAGVMTAPLMEARSGIVWPRLSPDGAHVAYATGNPGDIWVRDLVRGSDTRVTTDSSNYIPAWGPDRDTLTFISNRDGQFNLFVQPVDLSRSAERLQASDVPSVNGDWSSDGRSLVYYEITSDAGRDIWTLSRGESPRPLLATPFNERAPVLSPDDRWMAYVSDQSGTDQIHLMPFPGGGRVVPMSTTGGIEPMWSRNGRELFYRVGSHMWVVPFDTTSGLPTGKATLLFDAAYDLDPNLTGIANYDVSPDGQQFLMVRTAAEGSLSVTLVENWLEQLKRLVPTQ